MKIIQIGKYPPNSFGGIEKLVNRLNYDLNKNNIQNDIACFNLTRSNKIEISNNTHIYKCGTIFKIFSIPFSISLFTLLAKKIKRYDLVHLHLPNPIAAFYVLLLKKDIKKLTIHFHADYSNHPGYLFYGPIEKKVFEFSNKIIVTTNSLSNCKALRKFKKKIKVIPLFLSKKEYQIKNPNYNSLSKYKNMKFIIFVGRFVKYKNIDILIKAYSKFSKFCNLVLVGNGEEIKNIHRFIEKLKLKNSIFIEKNLDDEGKKYLLQKALFSVLPSTTSAESYGYVQVESMALGTPVVSFKIKNSGVSEVNKHKKTGLVIKVGISNYQNIKLLSKSFDKLIKNKSILKKYSNNALKESLKYQSKNLIKDYISIFNKDI